MRLLLLSGLCLLMGLPSLAGATEIDTDPNFVVEPQPYVELEVEVWQLTPEAAIAAGLDRPGATAADKNMRFMVHFRTLKPFRPLLDQARIDRQGWKLMETNIRVLSGYEASISTMFPSPVPGAAPADASEVEGWQVTPRHSSDFPGMLGLVVKFKPKLDDTQLVELAMRSQFQGLATTGEGDDSRPAGMQLQTTMRIQSGNTIAVANLISEAERAALHELVNQHSIESARFFANPPLPGSVVYLLITPRVIQPKQ